ncbi:MAG TPA: cytochrome P450 [Acidimicrobiales bacterium]|nr:cytochrome P450 [Acidimicrobiales bacterium]
MTIAYDPFDNAPADVYALYDKLRADDPVHWAPGTGTFVLSRHDDVAWALSEPGLFSSDAMRGVLMDQPTGHGEQRLPREDAQGMLVSVDPPEHTDLRRIVNRGFTPRRMQEWRAHMDSTVAELLDPARAGGSFDVIAGLAAPLPVRVICALVGADPAEADSFRAWADAMTKVMSGSARGVGLGQDEMLAMLQLADDLGRRIDERQREPREDLLTALVRAQDEDVLSRGEAVGFAALLLFAGTETTTNLIGNTVFALLSHPEELLRLRAEGDDTRLAAVIEETLRWESPVQYVFRRTTRPVTRHGVDIPVDSTVTLLLGSANRDPARWGDDADRFNADRDTAGHVAFGFGPHFCLGAALARAETMSALRPLVPRLVAGEHAVDGVTDWVDAMQFRGRHSLSVELRPEPET